MTCVEKGQEHPPIFGANLITLSIYRNLIAKNYRIYRIFNNIFVTRTVVTDWQLLKVSGSMALIESVKKIYVGKLIGTPEY